MVYDFDRDGPDRPALLAVPLSMWRDDPQHRGAGEHHREREQRGEQSVTERHGLSRA